jgi:hypothetical protein
LGNDDYLFPGRKLILQETASIIVDPLSLDMNEEEILEPGMNRKRSNSVAGMNFEFKPDPLKTLTKSGSNGNLSPRKAQVSPASLRDQLKASLNKGANISDIDKIFEHVLSESKQVNDRLKKVSLDENLGDPRKSFIKFYENASKGEIEDSMNGFIQVEEDNKVVKSEAYYCTKHGRVKGVLTVSDTYIMYDPLYCGENNKFNQNELGSKFQACIDIKDIVNVDIIKLPNETAIYIQDDESRQ